MSLRVCFPLPLDKDIKVCSFCNHLTLWFILLPFFFVFQSLLHFFKIILILYLESHNKLFWELKILKERVPVSCGGQVWVSRLHWAVVRTQLRGRNRNRPAAGQDQSYLYITSHQQPTTQQHSEAAHTIVATTPLNPTFLRFGESFARPFLNMHTLQKAHGTSQGWE